MSPSDAAFCRVGAPRHDHPQSTAKGCTTRFDDLIVRVDPTFKLEVHMDTDEADACDLDHADKVELFKS